MLALDPTAYDRQDTIGTLRALGAWWSQVTLGDPGAAWAAPQIAAQIAALRAAAGRLRVSVEEDAPLVLVDRTSRAVAAALGGAGWDGGLAGELLGRSLREIHATAAARRAAGAMPATATGRVHQVGTSGGGVPKPAAEQVAVAERGVVGDRQATRRYHGRPWQALCLWSLETIEGLAAEGHPIGPGSAGENVTVAGIPWAAVTSGVRLRVGEVLAVASAFAPPCAQNARWFSDGDFGRLHHDRGPGVSRIYASVVTGGTIRPGDAVVLEPSGPGV